MDKYYHINDNSVMPQTIHIKRVMAFTHTELDSLRARCYARKNAERQKVKEAAEAPFVYTEIHSIKKSQFKLYTDSVPRELKYAFEKSKQKLFSIDTSVHYLKIDLRENQPVYTTETKVKENVLRTAVIKIETNKTSLYYDAGFQLIFQKKLVRASKSQKIYRCTEYKDGKKVRSYKSIACLFTR
jgi:hypothetical protein